MVVTYRSPTAVDVVDGPIAAVRCSPSSGSVFALGTQSVTCVASDSRGNVGSAAFAVTVSDTAPPADVTDLALRAGFDAVTLSWRSPADADFAHVSITRSQGSASPVEVYKGAETQFTDRGVRPGARYTYVVAAHDVAGNSSAGVTRTVAVPAAPLLLSPANGARVSAPPVLRWVPSERATYYNVQLWRGGRKILSRWPARARLPLQATWRYSGRSYRLSAGRYRWYVWPGYGPRAAARYGSLLGQATFVVVSRS